MSNISLKLINFKQYQDVQFEGTGSCEGFIGTNGTGKSTALQAIETALTAKGFVTTPLNKNNNAKEANIVFKAQRDDQEPIQVSITIDEANQYSFVAAYIKDGKVKTIQDPKKIRELIGVYYPLTVESTLQMTAFAEGRRKFINEYLLPLLGAEKKARLETLQLSVSDKKNKATEGNLYFTRRTLQETLQGIEGELKASSITDEDKSTIASKNAVETALGKLKAEKQSHYNDVIVRKDIETAIYDLELITNGLAGMFSNLEIKHQLFFETEHKNIDSSISESIAGNTAKLEGLYTSEQLTALDDKITRGNNKLTEIATLSKRTDNTAIKTRRDEVFTKINDINKQIEDNKNEIKEIFTNSSLPAGIEIDEETIMLNGFELSENNNSNTEIRMAVIELLCKLNTSGYCNIGDWSLYGPEARKKILTFAKKNNMMFLGQLVSSDTETKLITIIQD